MVDLAALYANRGQTHLHPEKLRAKLAEAATSVQLEKPTTGQSVERSVRARLGEAGIAALADGYRAGRSTPELMAEFGLSKGATLKLLRRVGVDLRKQPPGGDVVVHARELYESGVSIVEIGKRLTVPTTTIRRALVQAGVTMRPRGGL